MCISLLPEYAAMVPDYLQCIILQMALSRAEILFLQRFIQTPSSKSTRYQPEVLHAGGKGPKSESD